MNIRATLRFCLMCCVVLGIQASAVLAAITTTGGTAGVYPADPSTWTTYTAAFVGYTGSGTLTVDGGSDIVSGGGYVGCNSGASGAVTIAGAGSTWTSSYSPLMIGLYGNGALSITGGGSVSCADTSIGNRSGAAGTVVVDGAGSTWTNSGCIFVGQSGRGSLSITNGGSVSAGLATYVGYATSSPGTIVFGANGGTLTTQSLLASPMQVTGTGTINTCGLVSDVDLQFNSVQDLKQTASFQQAGGCVAVNLDMSAARNGALGAGYIGAGTLTIQGGININSNAGYIGYGSNSTGVVTVAGSTWTDGGSLCVGNYGRGTLTMTNGGSVSVASTTYLGANEGSTGLLVFGTGGGTLSTRSFLGSPTQISGTGTINTQGIVSDVDLKFDSVDKLRQTLLLQKAGQNITVNLDMSGGASSNGILGAGWTGSGSLAVQNGGTVNSTYGYLGYHAGSTGTATVTGPGSTWNGGYQLNVGHYGNGSLSITNGGTVTDSYATVGYGTGSAGAVTVDGAGSTWTSSSSLYVGESGSGSLTITNGGTVNNHSAYVGGGSNSMVSVDGIGSTWANSSSGITIGAGAPHGIASVTITNGGTVRSNGTDIVGDFGSNGILVIDGAGSNWTKTGSGSTFYVGYSGNGSLSITHGGRVNNAVDASIGAQSGGNGTAVVDGVGSAWTNSARLFVGYVAAGKLSITNGGSVSSATGYIAAGSGSTGNVNVDGAGSTWTNGSGGLYFGWVNGGNGTLSITRGGTVTNGGYAYIGDSTSSTGIATVDDAGSKWTNTNTLYAGHNGTGIVSISGGGSVTAPSVSINSLSLLAIDVGRGSLLTVGGGTGTIANSGMLRFSAGVDAPAGTYTPISSSGWSGTGSYQAVGGKLNGHQVTVSIAVTGTSGSPVSIDLNVVQRLLITDKDTGWSVGASFLGAASTSSMSFTAMAMDKTVLASLKPSQATNESIVAGWTFASTDYAVGTSKPAYLSFEVGAGQLLGDMDVWHYSGGTWSRYSPADLTYDGMYASFTATSFSGYAIAVPEPSTLAILAAGLLFGILAYARRK
ncbi:MAG: PEP-CTERM sorting domain-containing protein [Planctomycetaceae bacterium]|nr:PEP-CTERM sorting domain-containing protein [Planctomycetaceae bacterium]